MLGVWNALSPVTNVLSEILPLAQPQPHARVLPAEPRGLRTERAWWRWSGAEVVRGRSQKRDKNLETKSEKLSDASGIVFTVFNPASEWLRKRVGL